MYKEWKSFIEDMPKSDCGLIIKIDSENEEVKDKFYYGYIIDNGYIFLLYNLTDHHCLSWKVLKEYNMDQIYWLFVNEFREEDEAKAKDKNEIEKMKRIREKFSGNKSDS